jgi:hypothetical protein
MFLICDDVRFCAHLSFLCTSTYVRWAIHQGADLIDSKVDHLGGGGVLFLPSRRGIFRSCEDEIDLRLEGSLELFGNAGCAGVRREVGVLEDNSQD